MRIHTITMMSAVCLLTSCGVVDEKGATCGPLDVFTNGDGDSYCPDEDAPEDCEVLGDAFIDRVVECAGQELSDEERAAVKDRLGCEDAVATTVDYEDCLDEIETVSCPAEGLLELPGVCEQVVLAT